MIWVHPSVWWSNFSLAEFTPFFEHWKRNSNDSENFIFLKGIPNFNMFHHKLQHKICSIVISYFVNSCVSRLFIKYEAVYNVSNKSITLFPIFKNILLLDRPSLSKNIFIIFSQIQIVFSLFSLPRLGRELDNVWHFPFSIACRRGFSPLPSFHLSVHIRLWVFDWFRPILPRLFPTNLPKILWTTKNRTENSALMRENLRW